MSVRLKKANRTTISNNRDNVVIFPSYLFMHCFFRTVQLRVQDKTLEYASDYPYIGAREFESQTATPMRVVES